MGDFNLGWGEFPLAQISLAAFGMLLIKGSLGMSSTVTGQTNQISYIDLTVVIYLLGKQDNWGEMLSSKI